MPTAFIGGQREHLHLAAAHAPLYDHSLPVLPDRPNRNPEFYTMGAADLCSLFFRYDVFCHPSDLNQKKTDRNAGWACTCSPDNQDGLKQYADSRCHGPICQEVS